MKCWGRLREGTVDTLTWIRCPDERRALMTGAVPGIIDDDWREPWQEQPQVPMPATPAAHERPLRRPLDAISRRGQPSQVLRESPAGAQDADADWPEDDNFRVERWSRGPEQGSRRSLPRSSRRRD